MLDTLSLHSLVFLQNSEKEKTGKLLAIFVDCFTALLNSQR